MPVHVSLPECFLSFDYERESSAPQRVRGPRLGKVAGTTAGFAAQKIFPHQDHNFACFACLTWAAHATKTRAFTADP
jgi:hypothetical protein